MSNCGFTPKTPKLNLVEKGEKPLVFKTAETVSKKLKITPIEKAVEEISDKQATDESYEKTTIIDDSTLKPRSAKASGWLWFGAALMAGGIVWKSL